MINVPITRKSVIDAVTDIISFTTYGREKRVHLQIIPVKRNEISLVKMHLFTAKAFVLGWQQV